MDTPRVLVSCGALHAHQVIRDDTLGKSTLAAVHKSTISIPNIRNQTPNAQMTLNRKRLTEAVKIILIEHKFVSRKKKSFLFNEMLTQMPTANLNRTRPS